MRVLIVDDHPIIVSGCAAMLAGEGDIEARDAGDAETALTLFVEWRRMSPSWTLICPAPRASS